MNLEKALERNNLAVLAWKNQKKDEALDLLFEAKKRDPLCPEVLFNQQVIAMALGETGLGDVTGRMQTLTAQLPLSSAWRLSWLLGTLEQCAHPGNPQARCLFDEARIFFEDLEKKGEIDACFQKEWIAIPDHYICEKGIPGPEFISGSDVKNRLTAFVRDPLPPMKSAAVSPDQNTAWVGHEDGQISLVNLEAGVIEKTFASGASSVSSLAYSPTGAFVVSCGGDSKIRLWDSRGGRLMRTFVGHRSEVRCLAMTPDGCRFLSGGSDGNLLLWDLMTGEMIGSLIIMKSGLWAGQNRSRLVACNVSPDGRLAVAGYDAGLLPLLWEISTGRTIAVLAGALRQVAAVSFSPDGRYVFGEDKENAVTCWNVEKPQHLQIPLIIWRG